MYAIDLPDGFVHVPVEVNVCTSAAPKLGAAEVHAEPLEVSTLPLVPAADKPVPPEEAGSIELLVAVIDVPSA
jgi:hypothetical protein